MKKQKQLSILLVAVLMAMTCVFGVGVFKTSLTASAAEPNALRAGKLYEPEFLAASSHYALVSLEFMQESTNGNGFFLNSAPTTSTPKVLYAGYYSKDDTNYIYGNYIIWPQSLNYNPRQAIAIYDYVQAYNEDETSEWYNYLGQSLPYFNTLHNVFKVITSGKITPTSPLSIEHGLEPGQKLFMSFSFYGKIYDRSFTIPTADEEPKVVSWNAYFKATTFVNEYENYFTFVVTNKYIQISAKETYDMNNMFMLPYNVIGLAKD